ncbi:MAG: hypothetical protein U0M06_00645 [Clostridia bacterium]|nr:hypothetical protein [Clostridia bacterium]
MRKCKYCGAERTSCWHEDGVCPNCHRKRPLVKELVAICQEIKKYKESRKWNKQN